MENINKRIIYAEDNLEIRKSIAPILEDFFPNAKIEIYKDGTSLKNRLEKNLQDVGLVITDNEMPGISGTEIIGSFAPKTNIPFVLAYGGEEFIGKKAIENGAFDYITKPFDLDKLIKVVERALGYSEK